MQDRPGWTKEMVQSRAYSLWHEDGCPDGNAWKYWFLAEQELEAERLRRITENERMMEVLRGNHDDR